MNTIDCLINYLKLWKEKNPQSLLSKRRIMTDTKNINRRETQILSLCFEMDNICMLEMRLEQFFSETDRICVFDKNLDDDPIVIHITVLGEYKVYHQYIYNFNTGLFKLRRYSCKFINNDEHEDPQNYLPGWGNFVTADEVIRQITRHPDGRDIISICDSYNYWSRIEENYLNKITS